MVVDYLGGFEYKAGVLQYFPTSEGYVDNTPSVVGANTYSYVYQYKDHLGNVRMNFAKSTRTGKAVIKDESHYYPFGLRHLDYNMTALDFQEIDGMVDLYPTITATSKLPYNYKFGGKESQEELGFQSYDFGARNYNPALGRWMNMDRLAEKFENFTPYQYAGNNPVYFIDVNGEYIYINDPGNPDSRYRYQNGQTQQQVAGKWQAIDSSVQLSDFVLSTVAGLNTLENSGKTGKGLVDHFSDEKMI